MSPRRGLPDRVETVLLDAGGVLLDLDYAYLRRLVESRQVEVDEQQLARLEALARLEIHRQVSEGGRVSDAWRDYFHIILNKVGLPPETRGAIIDALWEAHQRVGLWTVPIEGGPDTVAELKRHGYRLGVVSNAEGRVEQDLESAGYRGLLETVVDIALRRLDARPESTVFVGDVPAVDVEGARAAGLTPILIDRHDVYPDSDVLRLTSIRELPSCLDRHE